MTQKYSTKRKKGLSAVKFERCPCKTGNGARWGTPVCPCHTNTWIPTEIKTDAVSSNHTHQTVSRRTARLSSCIVTKIISDRGTLIAGFRQIKCWLSFIYAYDQLLGSLIYLLTSPGLLCSCYNFCAVAQPSNESFTVHSSGHQWRGFSSVCSSAVWQCTLTNCTALGCQLNEVHSVRKLTCDFQIRLETRRATLGTITKAFKLMDHHLVSFFLQEQYFIHVHS